MRLEKAAQRRFNLKGITAGHVTGPKAKDEGWYFVKLRSAAPNAEFYPS